jgi:hypothetical protein
MKEVEKYIQDTVNKIRSRIIYKNLLDEYVDEGTLLTEMFRSMLWKLPVLKKNELIPVIKIIDNNIEVILTKITAEELTAYQYRYRHLIDMINVSIKEINTLFNEICSEVLNGFIQAEIFEHICEPCSKLDECRDKAGFIKTFCQRSLLTKSSKYSEVVNKEIMDRNPLILLHNIAVISITNEGVTGETLTARDMYERISKYKDEQLNNMDADERKNIESLIAELEKEISSSGY